MCLDSIVTSAIIGLFGIIVGVCGYALQNWLIKKRERETQLFILKRERYEELVRKITHGIHIVKSKGERTTPDFKEKLDEAINVLWLYGSDNVLKALNAWLSSSDGKSEFRKLILTMRKELIETNLSASEIEWFRAI